MIAEVLIIASTKYLSAIFATTKPIAIPDIITDTVKNIGAYIVVVGLFNG